MKTTKAIVINIFTKVLIWGVAILTLAAISLSDVKIAAKADILNSAECASKQDSDRISVSSEKSQFNANEIIELEFHVDSLSEISNYTYQTNGFSIINISQQGRSIKVKLKYDGVNTNADFKLNVKLKNGSAIEDKLYSFCKDGMLFLSDGSYGEAKEKYYLYANENSILTENEINADRDNAISKETIVKKSNTKYASIKSNTIPIYTQLLWRDDNANDHPIAYTKFDVIDRGGSSTVTNTYYTDANGYFPSGITVASPANVDIRIYAAGSNTSVHKKTFLGINSQWDYLRSDFDPNVITMIFPVTMTTDFGRVQQISQALIFADRYVTTMRGSSIASIKAVYPDNSTHYNSVTEKIHLLGEGSDLDYADWDVIMHEYGHHVAHKLGIDDSPGGEHSSSENLADRYNKSKGIRLAWSESWATVFGGMAQEYYASELTNIDGVADGAYSDYPSAPNGTTLYNYNTTTTRIGEACELSIIGVLWDLFDNDTTETHDNITFTHMNF